MKRTKRIHKILNWPATSKNRLVPWYLLLRRLVFLPFLYAGLVLAFLAILCSYGVREAVNFWNIAS